MVWFCPQLPASPAAVADLLLKGVHAWPKNSTAAIGSSLGGFYATWLGALLDCKTVLLNPAVHPARDLAAYTGTHQAWHDPNQQVAFEPRFIEELKTLYVGKGFKDYGGQEDTPHLADPNHVLNMVAKGDEVLSWQEMVGRYPHASLHLIEGSDHGISDFELHFPVLKKYLGL
jgi:predicted esterase YcpF (UPF0227 family)